MKSINKKDDLVLMLPESYDLPENVGFSEVLTLDKPKTGKTLTEYEIDLLKKVITRAAKYDRVDKVTGEYLNKAAQATNVIMWINDKKKVVEYEDYADQPNLMMVILPDGLERIEDAVFLDCPSLMYIHIPKSVQIIDADAFQGCTFAKENFVNDSALDAEENDYWGATIVEREIDGMLIDRDVVKNLTLVCTRKGFYTTFTIPSDVEFIGRRAFIGCHSLNSVTIPDSVKGVGKGAFDYCNELKEIVCHAMTPPRGMDESFSVSTPNTLRVYVPQAAVAAYQADADWGKFNIQAIP